MTKFCDIDPKFPKTAWTGLILTRNKKDISLLVPVKKIYPTKGEEKLYLESVIKRAKLNSEKSAPVLVKIKLAELIKNKRELWTRVTKQEEVDLETMMSHYLDVFRYPKMYQLLAVGRCMDKKRQWEWGVIMRFLKGTDKKKIENFMCGCGEGVHPRCKYTALYDVEEIIFVRPDGREEKHNPKIMRRKEVLN